MSTLLISETTAVPDETAADDGLSAETSDGVMPDGLAPSRDESCDDEWTRVIAGCRSGDANAIATFVGRFERMIFGLCLRMLRDRHEAEDAAQETFVRAVRHLDTWDDSRPILPWLRTIAANRCRTFLKKRTRRPIVVETVTEQNARGERDAEIVEEVDRALACLPDRWREVVVMHYRGGLSCEEIARAVECAEGTVKTWLFRARQQLADELRGRGFDEGTTR